MMIVNSLTNKNKKGISRPNRYLQMVQNIMIMLRPPIVSLIPLKASGLLKSCSAFSAESFDIFKCLEFLFTAPSLSKYLIFIDPLNVLMSLYNFYTNKAVIQKASFTISLFCSKSHFFFHVDPQAYWSPW